jgi:multiple sugar transport system ATP-binding protein
MIYVTHDQIEALTLANRIAVMKDQKIQQLGTPAEIYHDPANLFVAGFAGSPGRNFVAGEIVADGAGAVFASGERRLPLDGYRTGSRLKPGQQVTLGVRPEHLALGEGGAWPGFAVQLVETIGADNLVWCGDGTQALQVRLPGDREVERGTTVGLDLDPPPHLPFCHRHRGSPLNFGPCR